MCNMFSVVYILSCKSYSNNLCFSYNLIFFKYAILELDLNYIIIIIYLI